MAGLSLSVISFFKSIKSYSSAQTLPVGAACNTCWRAESQMVLHKGEQMAKTKVQFQIDAPEAQEVFLAGDFNDWDGESIRLTRKRGKYKGRFATALSLEPGQFEYKFLIDGNWICDPDKGRVPNVFGTDNSLLNVQKVAKQTQSRGAGAAAVGSG